MELIVADHRIPPNRGLILSHNHGGARYGSIDLKRWVRHNRLVLKTEKVDFFLNGEGFGALEAFLECAGELEVSVSMRTRADLIPPSSETLRALRLHDLCLSPTSAVSHFQEWLGVAAEAGLGVRVQLQPPFLAGHPIDEVTDTFARHGVVLVNLVLRDPIDPGVPCRGRQQSLDALARAQTLAAALEEGGIEANIVGVPLCLVDARHLVRTANSQQCALDHNQYSPASFELARRLHTKSPFIAGRILQLINAQHEFQFHPADNLLYPWLLHGRTAHIFSGAFRRLTRPMRIISRAPRALAPSKERVEREIEAYRARSAKELAPPCLPCRFRGICDHATKGYREALTGVPLETQSGERVISPIAFTKEQRKYYDAVDRARMSMIEEFRELAEDARAIIAERAPDRRLMPKDYGVEDGYFERFEGGLKWFSVSNVEKLSTSLGRYEAPFTVSVDVGGGIADYAGFSLGRHCKLVCPMETFRHTVALHVDKDGRYVLLRDDRPVVPVEFEGRFYLPRRLAGVVQPRISIWNIEETITTHNIRIWEGGSSAAPEGTCDYSVIIVSTRFTRRLQAVLRSIAHQTGFDLSRVEVIVCYVPGIDATDDLLDSVALAYPSLRIVRSPFPERHVKSKGFLINESFQVARGEWIMLLDSDTLIPPDMFARIDAAKDGAEFIAPDGRKLLDKETTAKILLGEIEPWKEWRNLLEGPGEYRHREAKGVPVGFCQCIRAKHLKALPYLEMEHFEWADMDFGKRVMAKTGAPRRLSGTPVLHLDHGASQWFGTPKHL